MRIFLGTSCFSRSWMRKRTISSPASFLEWTIWLNLWFPSNKEELISWFLSIPLKNYEIVKMWICWQKGKTKPNHQEMFLCSLSKYFKIALGKNSNLQTFNFISVHCIVLWPNCWETTTQEKWWKVIGGLWLLSLAQWCIHFGKTIRW